MKIYIPIWEVAPHMSSNPYVETLVNGIKRLNNDVEFVFDRKFLCQDGCEKFDIIHFMWPHLFASFMSPDLFEDRITYLRRCGVKMVCTCHNITPHSGDDKEIKYYEIVYKNCDVIIHLGEYSRSLFCVKYPDVSNIVIPHHIYDDRYKDTPSREESLKHLGLPKIWQEYVLCLGAFRSHEEAQLVRNLSRKLLGKRIAILAPGLFLKPKLSKNCSNWLFCLKWVAHKYLYPNIVIAGRFVGEEELPYYFAASSVVLIQRIRILNSGNVPLALYMGKPVAGPDVGNVGELLNTTGNPTFNPYDNNSVFENIIHALHSPGLGQSNKEYAKNNLKSEVIASRVLEVYKNIK